MDLLSMSKVSAALCLLYCLGCWRLADGQYFEDPSLVFKPFEFDTILRGQYNVTQCVQDLLQCWEMMRPDVICSSEYSDHYDFETYCAMDKRMCHDGFGYYTASWYQYIAFIGYCQDGWKDWYYKGQWT